MAGDEGFGAGATGGGGGDTYLVTNMSPDVVAGSFRYGLSTKTGPRTIQFVAGGRIDLLNAGITQLLIANVNDLTILGNTAVTAVEFWGAEVAFLDCSNIILRHLRFRNARDLTRALLFYGTAPIGCRDVIIDHCSIQLSGDDNLSLSGNLANFTVSYCLMSGSRVSKSMLIDQGAFSDPTKGCTIHHCLFAANSVYGERQPKIGGGPGRIDLYNNVSIATKKHAEMQKSNGFTYLGLPRVNFINNWSADRLDMALSIRKLPLYAIVSTADYYANQFYLAGNRHNGVIPADQKTLVQNFYPIAIPSSTFSSTPIGGLVVVDSADTAKPDVINNAGATLPHRDVYDSQAVADALASVGDGSGAAKVASVESQKGIDALVSGTITNVAASAITHVLLKFIGTGSYAGVDFATYALPNGTYSMLIPIDIELSTGWTGRVVPYHYSYVFTPAYQNIGPAQYNHTVGQATPIVVSAFSGTIYQDYVTLVRLPTPTPSVNQLYELNVDVTAAAGIEPEIFLYAAKTFDPMQGSAALLNPLAAPLQFDRVCSPVDIEDFPVGSPDVRSGDPYFRLNSLRLLFHTSEAAEQAWVTIQEDVAEMCRTMRAMQEITTLANVVVTAGNRSVTLTPRVSAGVEGRTQAWKLFVDVVDTTGVAAEIFLLERRAFLVSDASVADMFSRVTTPSDLLTYSATAPTSNNTVFYRVRSLELMFRDPTSRQETWERIVADVTALINALAALDAASSNTSVVTVF